MPEIKILPSLVANQIAAGEVVERPASIIKELVENSLDAKATIISIDIEDGGKQLIRIRDNGCGIAKEQLELALASHATSKLRLIDDLNSLHSYGFRGEALASISSVSKLSLISRTENSTAAWKIYNEGKDYRTDSQPIAHPQGTTIEVAELFYNTPARQKFLKSATVEFGHIEDLIKRLAISHPEIEFNLTHNGRNRLKLKSLAAHNYTDRIAQVLPKFFSCDCFNTKASTNVFNMHLELIAEPDHAFNVRNNLVQYCYINDRLIKDKVLISAIKQAFTELFGHVNINYVLFLTIDPQSIDINVHPSKAEVRFHDSHLVHSFIFQNIYLQLAYYRHISKEHINNLLLSRKEDQSLIDHSQLDELLKTLDQQAQVQAQHQQQVTNTLNGNSFNDKAVNQNAAGSSEFNHASSSNKFIEKLQQQFNNTKSTPTQLVNSDSTINNAKSTNLEAELQQSFAGSGFNHGSKHLASKDTTETATFSNSFVPSNKTSLGSRSQKILDDIKKIFTNDFKCSVIETDDANTLVSTNDSVGFNSQFSTKLPEQSANPTSTSQTNSFAQTNSSTQNPSQNLNSTQNSITDNSVNNNSFSNNPISNKSTIKPLNPIFSDCSCGLNSRLNYVLDEQGNSRFLAKHQTPKQSVEPIENANSLDDKLEAELINSSYPYQDDLANDFNVFSNNSNSNQIITLAHPQAATKLGFKQNPYVERYLAEKAKRSLYEQVKAFVPTDVSSLASENKDQNVDDFALNELNSLSDLPSNVSSFLDSKLADFITEENNSVNHQSLDANTKKLAQSSDLLANLNLEQYQLDSKPDSKLDSEKNSTLHKTNSTINFIDLPLASQVLITFAQKLEAQELDLSSFQNIDNLDKLENLENLSNLDTGKIANSYLKAIAHNLSADKDLNATFLANLTKVQNTLNLLANSNQSQLALSPISLNQIISELETLSNLNQNNQLNSAQASNQQTESNQHSDLELNVIKQSHLEHSSSQLYPSWLTYDKTTSLFVLTSTQYFTVVQLEQAVYMFYNINLINMIKVVIFQLLETYQCLVTVNSILKANNLSSECQLDTTNLNSLKQIVDTLEAIEEFINTNTSKFANSVLYGYLIQLINRSGIFRYGKLFQANFNGVAQQII